jgi:hypothetical protein
MKSAVFQCVLAITLSCVGFSDKARAEDCKPCISKINDNEKCYLIPGSLLMDEKRLYVNFNSIHYPVNTVAVDELGVYVLASELVDSGIIAYCPDGHPNPPWRLVCGVCGKNLY